MSDLTEEENAKLDRVRERIEEIFVGEKIVENGERAIEHRVRQVLFKEFPDLLDRPTLSIGVTIESNELFVSITEERVPQ